MIYAMSDFHLYNDADKPMDIFGYKWKNHMNKIKDFWPLTKEDTIIIPGDLSWALKANELPKDLEYIESLPGKKILIKGNHDMWWNTSKKLKETLKDYPSIDFIFNDSRIVEDLGICGTRGWDIEATGETNINIMRREIGRLKASLDSCKAEERIVFLHYPPVNKKILHTEIFDTIKSYGIKKVYFGHLHGEAIDNAILGEYEGVELNVVASDQIDFKPILIR